MPATITATPDTETRLPARPDGAPWPLLLVHGDRVTGADTAGELLAVLIPGYDRLADVYEGRTTRVTTRRCGGGTNPRSPPPASCRRPCSPPPRCTATSTRPTPTRRPSPRCSPTRRASSTRTVWRHPVPLVLIDTDYQPFTARPRPDGHRGIASNGPLLARGQRISTDGEAVQSEQVRHPPLR